MFGTGSGQCATRLDREIAFAPHLPAGLGAPLLASGRFLSAAGDVRYAGFARVSGVAPGPWPPGVDAATARRSAGRIPPEVLRAACELRDAALIADDLRYALELPGPPGWIAGRVRDLEGLVAGRRWGNGRGRR